MAEIRSRSRRTASPPVVIAVVLGVTVVLGVAAPVAAHDVSRTEAAEQARAAADGDASAFEDLREVTSIDGRRVDLDPLLSGEEGVVAGRLDDLAATWSTESGEDGASTGEGAAGDPAGDPAADRSRAREVLDQDRFQEPDLPRPFRRPLQWIGERVASAWDRAVEVLAPVLGTRGAALVLVALLLAGLVATLVAIVRRRSAGEVARARTTGGWLVDPTLEPGDLEARADAASASGDHARAVRLRYEAGLLRLVDAGRLDLRPETTAGDAAGQVDDPTMDDLTVAFEEIVYGGRPAGPVDDATSREGWRTLLGARSRR